MQVNFIDNQPVADTLEQSNVLSTLPGPGDQTTYVLEFAGQDLLMIVDAATGDAIVIYPDGSFDAESGGSVHYHARAILGMDAT